MKNFVASLVLVSGLALVGPAFAQAPAVQGTSSPEAVTVVIQISLAPGAKPEGAVSAMRQMRDLIEKQPGFLSDEFLQNANPDNAPANVHVVRWASMKYWEQVFTSPDFTKLYAAGSKQYTVTASAFKTVK